jgi:hypothetical protein
VIDNCADAVNLLDKSDLSGKKKARDAAYNLATALLAYQLNISAGVSTCQAAVDAEEGALELLIEEGFDGTGKYLEPAKGKNADDPNREAALDLMGILDAFNNNDLCP